MTGIIPIRRRSMCTFFLVLVLLLVEKQEYYTSFGKTGGASRSVPVCIRRRVNLFASEAASFCESISSVVRLRVLCRNVIDQDNQSRFSWYACE